MSTLDAVRAYGDALRQHLAVVEAAQQKQMEILQFLREDLDGLQGLVGAVDDRMGTVEERLGEDKNSWALPSLSVLIGLLAVLISAWRDSPLALAVLRWGRRPGGGFARFATSLLVAGVADIPTLLVATAGFLWNRIEDRLYGRRPADSQLTRWGRFLQTIRWTGPATVENSGAALPLHHPREAVFWGFFRQSVMSIGIWLAGRISALFHERGPTTSNDIADGGVLRGGEDVELGLQDVSPPHAEDQPLPLEGLQGLQAV